MIVSHFAIQAKNRCLLSTFPFLSFQIPLRFHSLSRMNRGNNGVGQGSCTNGNSAIHERTVSVDNGEANGRYGNVASGGKNGCLMYQHVTVGTIDCPIIPHGERKQGSSCGGKIFPCTENIEQGRCPTGAALTSIGSNQSKFKRVPECSLCGFTNGSSFETRDFNKRTKIDLRSETRTRTVAIKSLQFDISPLANATRWQGESSLPIPLEKKGLETRRTKSPAGQRNLRNVGHSMNSKGTDLLEVEPFDICSLVSKNNKRVKAPWNSKDEESCFWIETVPTIEETRAVVLRPGMVLLKKFLTLTEQVQIVKTCRELGLGPGGFYQPGYSDGAKLRLQMMCLGLNWDPETRKYENRRPVDGCEPPDIPHEFSILVKRAIQDAHSIIREEFHVRNVEDMLPSLSPNICIVNFYSTCGRLGLHQDRDESRESLCKGLPVVSVSLGDSADFLYGDQRYVKKAESIMLESGDVLIFGGESRHIFHGVESIIPNSAPEGLLEGSKLRPGRLNLTFRQY